MFCIAIKCGASCNSNPVRREVHCSILRIDLFNSLNNRALVQDISEGGIEGDCLRLAELVALLQVEIRLRKPWQPLGVGGADRNRAGTRILADVDPLSTIHEIDRERTRIRPSAHIDKAGKRCPAVSVLEDSEVGRERSE